MGAGATGVLACLLLRRRAKWEFNMQRVECKGLVAALAGTVLTAMISTSPAAAADLGGYKPAQVPPPVIEPVQIPQSWAGWYLGANLGGIIDGDNDGDITGGAHLGHNWQFGNFVFGGEGDLEFAEDPEIYGSIRARAGLALSPRWLVYGTAGIAIDEHDEGLVAGGGLEYKVADQTSIGVEALNYDLDDNFTVLRGRLTWHFGGGRF